MKSRHTSRLAILSLFISAFSAQGADDTERAPGLQVFPVDNPVLHVVSNASGVAGDPEEQLAYNNPLGAFAAELPAGFLVVDDMKLNVLDGCALRRFRFQIIGKAHDGACGPVDAPCEPLTVDYALYDECPGAGGAPIAGTEGCASSDPARTDCIAIDSDALTDINVTAPVGETISLPSRVWLGVRMSRDGAGVVLGAPALKGFSDDVIDFPSFPCHASIGGFPENPYASFNASVYTDAACAATHLTYQNIRASGTGRNLGPNVCIADDINLNRVCNMVEMEIGVRDKGLFDVELRPSVDSRPKGGCPTGTVDDFGINNIPGTWKRFLVTQDGLAVRRFVFDPPIPLPAENLFAVVRINNPNAQWILTRRNASVGGTFASYFAYDTEDGAWDLLVPTDNSHGGMHFTISCAGDAPVGACCDQYVRDEHDEAVCRDVPEINCPFPGLRNELLRPAWAEGVACRVCKGGDRDTQPCRDDAACPGGVCVDNDPFVLPCGLSACCKPDGACENLTKNECAAVEPVDAMRDWHVGEFCGEGSVHCPSIGDCFGAAGDCLSCGAKTCNGGPDAGDVCNRDADCGGDNDGTCVDVAPQCAGGDHNGQSCSNDLNCIPGGLCVARACEGGVRAGDRCTVNRDCHESFCAGNPGCSDPRCCEMICWMDAFCCEVDWDCSCADMAIRECTHLCPTGTLAAIDPPHGVVDAGVPTECGRDTPLGIKTLTLSGPAYANAHCWSFCESGARGEPNAIAEIVEAPRGTYTITLNRPMTPGACTSIIYDQGGPNEQSQTFMAHPGDVGADGVSNATDVLDLIDNLNGHPSAFGKYSSDVDRSGVANAADVLAVIDLLNGADCFDPWNNVAFPGCGDCPEP